MQIVLGGRGGVLQAGFNEHKDGIIVTEMSLSGISNNLFFQFLR